MRRNERLEKAIGKFLTAKFGQNASQYFARWSDEDPMIWYVNIRLFDKYQEVLKEITGYDDLDMSTLRRTKVALDLYFLELLLYNFPELKNDKIMIDHEDRNCFHKIKESHLTDRYGYVTWISPAKS